MSTFSFEPSDIELTLDDLLSRPYRELSKTKQQLYDPRDYGTKILKRKLLGICGLKAKKSLYQLSDALVDSGIASTLGEAERIIPKFLDTCLYYDIFRLRIRETSSTNEYLIILD